MPAEPPQGGGGPAQGDARLDQEPKGSRLRGSVASPLSPDSEGEQEEEASGLLPVSLSGWGFGHPRIEKPVALTSSVSSGK